MNEIEKLAQHIRIIDGNHDMGAGALAEKLIELSYLPVEEVQLEGLTPDEVSKIVNDCYDAEAWECGIDSAATASQAVIYKNQKGKLYRRVVKR